jgi:hypothetical protein
MAFLTKWRTLSAFLYRNSPFPQDDHLRSNISHTISTLDHALAPFATPSPTPNARLQNLAALVQRATDFAATLFAQPAFWTFDWVGPRREGGEGFVVFPGLVRLTDGEGRPLGAPEVVEGAKVVLI